MNICRLCLENRELKNSHIVPKLFFRYFKQQTVTGVMRTVANPNKPEQDGLKVEFLCEECERKFNKYETQFANEIYNLLKENVEKFSFDSNFDYIAYFVLSIAWRVARYNWDTDKKMVEKFSQTEQENFEQILEDWREVLFNEQFEDIKKYEMHIIPTEKLFSERDGKEINNIGMDVRAFGEEDNIYWSFVFIRVPHLIFLCTLMGSAPAKIKSYRLGKTIQTKKSVLPNEILKLLNYYIKSFKESTEQLTENQKNKIIERVTKVGK